MGELGCLYDDSRGKIEDILYFYNPCTHTAVADAIRKIPANFIVYQGLGTEKVMELLDKKGDELMKTPGGEDLLKKSFGFLEKPDKTKSMLAWIAWIRTLQQQRTRLALTQKKATEEYATLEAFFEFAALSVQVMNAASKEANGKSPEQLKALAPERVHLRTVDTIINLYGRDVVIAFEHNDIPFLMPNARNLGNSLHDDDFMRALPFDHKGIFEDSFLAQRGYHIGQPLALATLDGGQLVSGCETAYCGFGILDTNRLADSANPRVRKDIEKELRNILPKKSHFFELGNSTDHIDMLVVPFTNDCVGLVNVAQTKSRLERARIFLSDAESQENLRVHNEAEVIRNVLRAQRINIVDLPGISLQFRGAMSRLSYANVLLDEKNAYVPTRGKSIDSRIATGGKIMDDWAENAFQKYKHVTPLLGFDRPDAWASAGIRCVLNVIRRSKNEK